jgi:hypothetical protein
VKEREIRRYLEYLGVEPSHPSERKVVRPPSREAKAANYETEANQEVGLYDHPTPCLAPAFLVESQRVRKARA